MMKHRRLFIFLMISFLGSAACFAADYLQETDTASLESSARYNYYIGEYYYSQGKYQDAEQYFQRSRDLVERKEEMLVKKEARAAGPAGLSGATSLEYTVGEGDVLFVSVWQNDDLNQETIVRPDGKISFPLVGDVAAAGHTITQIDADITQRLKEFIKIPDVSISLRKLGGCKVIILGQVGRPGVYAVTGSRTILEAIALAGGFTSDAVGNSVILIRGGLAQATATRLNLKKVLRGTDFAGNIPLQTEDIIFVPRTFVSDLAAIAMQIIDPVSRGSFIVDFIQKWDRG